MDKLIVIIVYIAKTIAKWVHRLSSVFTDLLSGALVNATVRLEKKDSQKFTTVLSSFGILQIVIVIAAFIFSRDQFRLFCDIVYTTPAGAVAGLIMSFAQSVDIDAPDALIIGFLGDSFTWITCGIQAVFAAWYSSILEKYEPSKYKRIGYSTAFTFFIGIILTYIIDFLYSTTSPFSAALNIPVIGTVLFVVLYAVMIITLVIALDNAIANIKTWAMTVACLIPVLIIFSFILDSVGGEPALNLPSFFYCHFDETVEIGVLLTTLLGYCLSRIVFKKRKGKTQQEATEEFKQEQLKRQIKSVVNKNAAWVYPLDSCCICHRGFEGGYAVFYKTETGQEVRLDSSCYNALNALSSSNDPNLIKQAQAYMNAVLPMTDANIRCRVQPFIDRGNSVIKG